jgi:hypothetical protein
MATARVLTPGTLRMLAEASGTDAMRAAAAAVDRDVARAEHARRLGEFEDIVRRGRGPAPRHGTREQTGR